MIFGTSVSIIGSVTWIASILRFRLPVLVVLVWVAMCTAAPAQEHLAPAEKQVVVQTDLGMLVLELYPHDAPNHVAAFQKRVREGFYVGTAFHTAIPWAIVQGGDPLTRDPANRSRYGTGD